MTTTSCKISSVVLVDHALRAIRWRGSPPQYIHISDDIDTDTGVMFEKELNDILGSGQPFVPVQIHSLGGDVYTALKIVDAIENCPIPVITILSGCAMSAAAVVFATGKRRFMSRNSTLMLHDVSIEVMDGRLKDIQAETHEMARVNEQMYGIMCKAIGKPHDFFQKTLKDKHNVDCYIGPEQALEWGLATDLGCPRFVSRVKVEHELWVGEEKVSLDLESEDEATANQPVSDSNNRRRSKRRRQN